MAATKELSIDEKLQQLWELQQIDSKIDKIQILKGELPIEVKELEDEIEPDGENEDGNIENDTHTIYYNQTLRSFRINEYSAKNGGKKA